MRSVRMVGVLLVGLLAVGVDAAKKPAATQPTTRLVKVNSPKAIIDAIPKDLYPTNGQWESLKVQLANEWLGDNAVGGTMNLADKCVGGSTKRDRKVYVGVLGPVFTSRGLSYQPSYSLRFPLDAAAKVAQLNGGDPIRVRGRVGHVYFGDTPNTVVVNGRDVQAYPMYVQIEECQLMK